MTDAARVDVDEAVLSNDIRQIIDTLVAKRLIDIAHEPSHPSGH